MGKRDSSPDPSSPVPGNVTDEAWAKLLLTAAKSPNGETWFANALANEENAQSN